MSKVMGFTKKVALVVTLTLSACGSSSSSDAISDSGNTIYSAVPDSVASVSGAMNDDDAGELYLEIVNPVNCEVRAISELENANSMGDGTVDPSVLPEMKYLYSALGAARERAVRDFLEVVWPSTVATDIEMLAREWSKAARAETAISTVVDLGAYNIAMTNYLDLLKNSDANPGYIRSALGVGPATETDQC
jgi:hypothetical protein